MDMEQAFSVSASALDAQRSRLNLISSNIANAESTRTPEGGPYRRREVIFTTTPFKSTLEGIEASKSSEFFQGVQVTDVVEDPRELRKAYEPQHPDANAEGYVLYPNVNIMEETVNMMSALRAYEANVTALNATKSMALKALEIGR